MGSWSSGYAQNQRFWHLLWSTADDSALTRRWSPVRDCICNETPGGPMGKRLNFDKVGISPFHMLNNADDQRESALFLYERNIFKGIAVLHSLNRAGGWVVQWGLAKTAIMLLSAIRLRPGFNSPSAHIPLFRQFRAFLVPVFIYWIDF